MSGWSDVWTVVQEAISGSQLFGPDPTAQYEAQLGQPGTVGNAINTGAQTSSGAWGAVTGFLVAITDWHLWASLGWVLLGLVLILIGARLWLGKSALPVPSAIPVPV